MENYSCQYFYVKSVIYEKNNTTLCGIYLIKQMRNAVKKEGEFRLILKGLSLEKMVVWREKRFVSATRWIKFSHFLPESGKE
jgi:hypothetical protein